ncbi:hypothetical protein SAMN05443247_04935 [Bradyrhizobium erythrophlei]|jgi:hypothetical protein|nr:hypothetical protein SAMN05443247_04935 [Bradyrhizobium erythrophlei]
MATNSNNLVTTPGGVRPADHVHTVIPDDVVQRDGTGAFTVTRKPRVDPARTKQLVATGLYAFTPGGIRPKSMIHTVEPGQIVNRDLVFKRFDLRSGQFIPLPPVEVAPPHLPALGSGWITYAAFTENSANVISSMTTTWVVPPAPKRQDNQLIYIFNGLQDSPVTHILQPVLQWGTSPDGGGNRWAVASWFVDSSGNAFKTPLVNVNEGDVLTGAMRLTGQSGTLFNYTCEFSGIAGTSLQVNSANQMVMPVEVLECYSMSECRDYPNTLLTAMRSISVNTANASLALNFGAANSVTDCGQHTIVVSNAASAGEVDLYYTSQFSGPSPSVVSSLSRSRDQLDLFAVGFDGGVYSTFWNPDGGWFDRWFRLIDTNFGDLFTVPPQTEVSVLSRFADHIDLFAVGRDSAVYSTFWDANGGWFNHWFRLADTNFADGFKVPIQTPISVLSRFTDHIDLFVTGFDGGVYSTFWDANGGWFNRWFRLGDTNFGDNFTIPPGSPISNLSRFRDHIDLFVSGRDGGVYSTFWDANGGWFNHWFRLGDNNFGDNFTVPPGSPISSLSRFQDHIDLFVSGRDGGVYSTFWDANGGWFNHWFRLGDSNFADNFTIPPGSPVSSLSRFRDHIDLFVTGFDGGIYSTFWDANGGWFNHWFRLGDTNFGDNFTIPPGSRVSALSRFQDHIDLFVMGRDGGIYSTFWDANGGWFGRWFRV